MVKQPKPLEQQIDEYKNDSRFTAHKTSYGQWINPTWHWDDSWDGQLIKDVIALDQAGFTIVSFSRKRKVTLKAMEWTKQRSTIVDYICSAVGNTWCSISFKPTLSVYWKGRSNKWNY